MTAEAALDDLGFQLAEGRRGVVRYTKRSNPYLSWWVQLHPDGTAELGWEFELGAYLKAKDLHVSVQDELSLLLYPSDEVRGPATAEWVTSQVEEAARRLDGLDLLQGT